MEASVKANPSAIDRPLLASRVWVWLRNLRNIHVAIAYRVLARAMQKDAHYAQSWQANIAMPIYDGTRFRCDCDWDMVHKEGCSIVKAHDMRAYECGEMNIEHANYIADNLMRHLFGVHQNGN